MRDYCFKSLKFDVTFPGIPVGSLEPWIDSMEMYMRELVFNDRELTVAIDVLRNLALNNEAVMLLFMRLYSARAQGVDELFAELIGSALVDIWNQAGRLQLSNEMHSLTKMAGESHFNLAA
jgi:deoxyhypusine synthase